MNHTFHLQHSMGKIFRDLVANSKPLQIIGTINAYTAILAEKTGHKAIYLSGSGVATASYGLPDLGITTIQDVVEDARRITRVSKLPLLVDIDTGFGTAFNIARCIQEMERVGVAAVHMEDQVSAKRCGHRPKKQIVPKDEMVDRIKVASNARTDPQFVIMARTDALASEGIEKAIERAQAYVAAGADMIFAEACTTLEEYKQFTSQLKVPVLANITEFGKTPLFTGEELNSVGVSMVLYPLTGFRAMNKTCMNVYETIKKEGSQKSLIDQMQTRNEFYETIDYHKYENQLDTLFESKKK